MQNINMQAPQRVPASTFSAKFSSKKECFNFLSVEVEAYLCNHETPTVYFLRQLIAGTKKCKAPPIITALAACRY